MNFMSLLIVVDHSERKLTRSWYVIFFVFCWASNIDDFIKPINLPHIIPEKNELNVRDDQSKPGREVGHYAVCRLWQDHWTCALHSRAGHWKPLKARDHHCSVLKVYWGGDVDRIAVTWDCEAPKNYQTVNNISKQIFAKGTDWLTQTSLQQYLQMIITQQKKYWAETCKNLREQCLPSIIILNGLYTKGQYSTSHHNLLHQLLPEEDQLAADKPIGAWSVSR